MKHSFLFYTLLLAQSISAFAPSPRNGFNALSVSELKRLLTERGVDFRDCLEKRDLVERLENSKAVPVSPRSSLGVEETRLISTFQNVSPAVAFITTTVRAKQRFSLQEMEVPIGNGSGFLWDSKGHIVTNYHVVAGQTGNVPKQLKVKLADMAEAAEAIVVGVEPEKDLAVLKINVRNLPKPLDVGTSADLQVGQSVLAIGNPFGLDNTLTTGVVSATGRDVQGIGGRPIRGCIQTDAAINPGNSGGPLLDSSGKLIGVNTAIYTGGGGGRGNVGIGFAIPVDTVRRVVNQIIRYGRVVRPTLGINVVDDRLVQNIGRQLRRKLEGVLVAEVLPGSPAWSLQATTMNGDGTINLGDLITHVDGEPVKQVEDLISEIEKREEGDTVRLTVMRNGVRGQYMNVTLVSRDVMATKPSRGSRGTQQFTSSWQ